MIYIYIIINTETQPAKERETMKVYAKTTEETLITFQISGGGGNRRKVEYCAQDCEIDSYTSDLFISFENERKVKELIGDRENLNELFEKALMFDDDAFLRIEKVTGVKLGKRIYVNHNGNPVRLDVDNDGTGVIDEDGDYDTTIVTRLSECDDEDLLLIYKSSNHKSSDVQDYCKQRLLEVQMIFEDDDND